MTTTFILSVDSTPAAYNNDNENPTITKNADASDEDFADYINSITSVSVNGKSYAASGRGATKLINDGWNTDNRGNSIYRWHIALISL